jgi:hypothetical protein
MFNGENDSQTTVQQAFLLQQRLTDVNHPDYTLITYPDLGDLFYPSSQWQTGIDQYSRMYWQIFIHGLKLIMGSHL